MGGVGLSDQPDDWQARYSAPGGPRWHPPIAVGWRFTSALDQARSSLAVDRLALASRGMTAAFRLCLILLATATAAAATSQPFLNLQVSQRDLALNQVVRVAFNTNPPQREDINIVAELRRNLLLPQVAGQWRLASDPEVVIHERMRDVAVVLHLQPREVGELELPTIPLTWLDGDRVAELGSVSVREQIALGDTFRNLPAILAGPGPHPWGSSEAGVSSGVAEDRITRDDTGTIIAPNPRLQLIVRGDRLVEARIHAPQIELAGARPAFIDRWGDPAHEQLDGDDAHILWTIGWLRIRAQRASEGGVAIQLVHEGVANQVASLRVEREVFDVLDGSGWGQAGSSGATSGGAEADTSAAGNDAESQRERQAEAEEQFERLMNRPR